MGKKWMSDTRVRKTTPQKTVQKAKVNNNNNVPNQEPTLLKELDLSKIKLER